MITGLHVDVPSAELKILLQKRLEHHQSKVRLYQEQVEKMQQVNAALQQEAEGFHKGSTRSPEESLRESILKHENHAIYYRFMAEHVIPDETYRLNEQDLMRLGIDSRSAW
jgi:hypothetical protein